MHYLKIAPLSLQPDKFLSISSIITSNLGTFDIPGFTPSTNRLEVAIQAGV
jgi:hypothetical protein